FGEFGVGVAHPGFDFLAGGRPSRAGRRMRTHRGGGDIAEAKTLFRGFVIRVDELRLVELSSHGGDCMTRVNGVKRNEREMTGGGTKFEKNSAAEKAVDF